MTNDVLHEMGEKLREFNEEAIKEMMRFTGLDPDTINAENAAEVKMEMQRRGYELEQIPGMYSYDYNLYHRGEFVFGIRSTHEMEYKDDKVTIKSTVKMGKFGGQRNGHQN